MEGSTSSISSGGGGGGARSAGAPSPPTSSSTSLHKQPSSGHLSAPTSTPASTGASPHPSRSTSPLRQHGLSANVTTQPSAAAIQRALSAAATPRIAPTSGATTAAEPASRTPRRAGPGETPMQWPVSPRLKSPPPSAAGARRNTSPALKKVDGAQQTSTADQLSLNAVASKPITKSGAGEDSSKPPLQVPSTTSKAVPRGVSGMSVLETVQEGSFDEPKSIIRSAASSILSTTESEPAISSGVKHDIDSQLMAESGSESADKTSAVVSRTRSPAPSTGVPNSTSSNPTKVTTNTTARVKSSAKTSTVKSRQNDGPQGMTVETETVSSIPQSAIGTADRSGGRNDVAGGSIRLKPSTETIRPKKERRKASHKPRSVNQNNASSKADIFEARVANAVDEANSSDSDETFVYESNPPDSHRRSRHHSRTPSVTSANSGLEQTRNGIRNFTDVLDDRRVAGKRSMKFSNNFHNDHDDPDGTVRVHQPRHFGRFGRGGSYASTGDESTQPTQTSKLRPGQWSSQRRSRPNSPRGPQSEAPPQQQSHRVSSLFGKKQEPAYDMDIQGADDERTPLMNTVRGPRSTARNARRVNISSSLEAGDRQYGRSSPSRLTRHGGCFLGLFVLIIVILSAIGFLVMSNRPLYNVHLLSINNVLASEQELLFDLSVGAINPNTIGVTIADIDLDILAKSRYVGTDRFWRDHGFAPPAAVVPTLLSLSAPQDDLTETLIGDDRDSGIDKGTDPPSDLDPDLPPGADAQVMLLGRLFHFDQPLSFDGSPLKRHSHISVGSLRLRKPGNKTETGGTLRWERVLLHPFDLIVKGSVRYTLPVSQRTLTASIGGEVRVIPSTDDDGKDGEDGNHVDDGVRIEVPLLQRL